MIKKILLYLLLSFSLFVFPINSNAAGVLFDYATYFFDTGSNVTVSWDTPVGENPAFLKYELRMKFVEQNSYKPITTTAIAANSVTFKLPKVGHYIVEARTIRTDANNVVMYSDWTTSIDSGMIGTVKRSWWVYGKLATPGIPIIGTVEKAFVTIYKYFTS
jgi:hypothetical protein